MTDPHDPHAPTDEFVQYLARDIRRTVRHQARFAALTPSAAPVASAGPVRRAAVAFGMAASMMVSLLTGIVLGASANAATAATPSYEESRFAIPAIKTVFKTIGCAVTPAPAHDAADPAHAVATVDLPAATARTAQWVSSVLGLAQMADGRVLVNDGSRRQLRLFDADLATSTVVLDSLPIASRSYASAGLGTVKSAPVAKLFMPFHGDSSIFGPDGPPEQNMIVLDAAGRAVRTVALASMDLPAGFTESGIVFDPRGRLIYRHSATVDQHPSVIEVPNPGYRSDRTSPFAGGGRGAVGATMRVYLGRADTLPVMRVDFAANTVDTLGYVMLPPNSGAGEKNVGNGGGKLVLVPGAGGKADVVKQVINPLATVDDWAVLSDGTIAFVRGRDYHIDWIHPDGTRSASPRLPFEWQRLGVADKQRLVDSTRAAVDALDALAEANASPRTAATPDGRAVRRQFPYEIVSLTQIPDFYPPIRSGAATPDADGNLWILPNTVGARNGTLVYDVVNPRQGLVRRVRLPAGRTIAGFGTGGVVYLQLGDPSVGVVIERTSLPGLARR